MSKFEKKFSKYAIPNLSMYLILGYVIGYFIQLINEDMYSLLVFNPNLILHGQIWRIITWVLVPPGGLDIFTIIMLILYYQLGRGLEHTWGTYRFNVYMFSGLFFTVIGAMILYIVLLVIYGQDTGVVFGIIMENFVSTYYINMSIFLAYAFTYPEEQLMLYFIVPVKMKWMGVLYGALIIFDGVSYFKTNTLYGVIVMVLIASSLLNFIIYMMVHKSSLYSPKQVKRRKTYKKSVKQGIPKTYDNGARHKCVICGRTELDEPTLTFRYCSKCTGGKEYCQDHLFTHNHK
jgi:hypothetical protein